MNRLLHLIIYMGLSLQLLAAEQCPVSVSALLDRIGGKGFCSRVVCELETDGSTAEQFIITQKDGKPCIKGTSVSAITTGVNWYLNHYARVNIAWNNLGDIHRVRKARLPLPAQEETHICNADYRYYLNYCTFSYSMATWTWARWEQEIDWMALHGVNMPLQIIGMDVVWRDMLIQDYGYSKEEANAFVAGPAFQAWWGMNNLEGWGGPNPDWWYERQKQLAKKILQRERELGMEPVLPGFSGTVPHDFTAKTGNQTESQGGWFGFTRPFIMDPTSADFARVASNYYHHLHNVMGRSKYYSMDPFHEGGRIKSGKYSEGYHAIYEAMNENCGADSKWVIQQWYWAPFQALSLTAVPQGRLIVLDLFADGDPRFDTFRGYAPQEAIFCTIPNFGGRTGFFGSIPRMTDNYFAYRQKYNTIRGIGAAPEAIEQTPVVYDLLFELPWMADKPDLDQWITDYADARYGKKNVEAEHAWQMLLHGPLNNCTALQGPHEAVICARPSLDVKAVSTWGGCDIFYNEQDLISAARVLLSAKLSAKDDNYSYDVVDIVRQVLTDHSKSMLADLKRYEDEKDNTSFCCTRDSFLQLILDIDALLGTNRNFRLGSWTEKARAIADEGGRTTDNGQRTTDADRNWLELDNARTLISTWGNRTAAEGGLRDYSYREWQGMLKDYYYPRWQMFFHRKQQINNTVQTTSDQPIDWFQMEWAWAHNDSLSYSSKPQGNALKIAEKLMTKYISH